MVAALSRRAALWAHHAFKVLALAGLPLCSQSNRYELPPSQRTNAIRQIFVVSHSHLDIGFTKPPDQVAREYKDNIDTAIRLVRENGDFWWTIESAWMLEEWLRRTEDESLVRELGELLRSGRIALGAAFANMHSGLMNAEESNRLVYVGHRLRKRFGIDAAVAYQNDVPGFIWPYPRILSGSGVKFLVTGLNLFIGGGNNLGPGKNPFYWRAPDGSRVLTWYTYDSYVEGFRWNLSPHSTLAEAEQTTPRRLAWLERNGYRYDTYLLMHSPGDNADPSGAYRILLRLREWNRKHPELPMRMATAEQFFEYLIDKYGDHFPEASGDSAGHWEIIKLGGPESTAKMRITSNLLPTAETLATIVSLLAPGSFPKYDFREAWRELLVFHEHTASAQPGWPGYLSRWETDWNNVAHYAAAISGYSNTVQQFEKALDRAARTSVKPGEGYLAVIYNGLSWKRSGPVIIDHLPAELREGALAVKDLANGESLSCEDVPNTRRQILCFARDVPAVGYRLYSIRKGTGAPRSSKEFPLRASWNAAGLLTSLRDEESSREIIEQLERPFGALFVARDHGDFRLESQTAGQVRVENGPVTRRVEISRPGSALPLTVLSLYREAAYADLRFDVDLAALRNGPDERLRYAVSFPMVKGRQLFLDSPGALVRVPQDFLPGGSAPHYMPLHFAHLQQAPEWGVTLANRDSFALRPDFLFVVAGDSMVARTRDEGDQRLFLTEPRGSPVQSFHFRLGIQGSEKWQWKRFGAEFNLPLQTLVLRGTTDRPSQSFFALSHPNIQLLAFKPAEHFPGRFVLRLQEIAGTGVGGVKLSTPFRIYNAMRASTVEEPTTERVNLASLRLEPWETLTILAEAQ